MEGLCRLYHITSELKESHIIPKFIIDYFKKTGSNFLRGATQPNRRMQDGQKGYYLSERAELEFSKREKWFAEKIFKPFLDEKRCLLEYDENLYYFLVSLLWRGLISELDKINYKNESYYNTLLDVEKEWREYLKGGAVPTRYFDVNLFLTEPIWQHNLEQSGVGYYFTRTLDITVFANDDGSFIAVYCKFLRFMVWAVIKDIRPNINSDLIINPNHGFIHFPQQIPDAYMLKNAIKRVGVIESLPGVSESQKEKIYEEIKRNPDSLFNSDAGRAIRNDWDNLDPK